MGLKKILWLEDQLEDFRPYLSALFRSGYIVDPVQSVSDVLKKLREEKYLVVIFDIKVLPGDDEQWIELDNRKRVANPYFDSYLGLELMYSLFNPSKAKIKIEPPVQVDPKKVIVFSVVFDKTDEISSFGIPGDQIIYKSNSDLSTLPLLIKRIEENECIER